MKWLGTSSQSHSVEPNSVDSGHDEIGPVEIDELTATHYANMNKRIDMSDNIDASTDGRDSQECVGTIE